MPMAAVPVAPRTTLAPDCRLSPLEKDPVMVSVPVGPDVAPRTLMVPPLVLDVKPDVPNDVTVASCWMAKVPVPFKAMLRPPRI